MKKLFFWMICVLYPLFLDARNVEEIDLRYYPGLDKQDRYEIQMIKRNYHLYGPLLKKIANSRVSEIKLKLLPAQTRVAIYYSMINDAVNRQDISADVLNVIQHRRQGYMSLSEEDRKQLISFNLSLVGYEGLSTAAKDFLSGSNLLISDNHRN